MSDDRLREVQAKVAAAPIRVKAMMSLMSELFTMVPPREAMQALVLTCELLSAYLNSDRSKNTDEMETLERLMKLPSPPEND